MRSRSDAGTGRTLIDAIHLEQITRPADPRLGDLMHLLNRAFPDPNSVLGLDRIQEFLSENGLDASRKFVVLAAFDTSGLVGASIFSYVERSNCGFSEYLVVDHTRRQRGLGRVLFDGRQSILDAEAVQHGHPACRGVFIEVDSPWRTPPDLLALESVDPIERLKVFGHLGFRRVGIRYTQPPLAADKQAVPHMDLLFAPRPPAPIDGVPSEWVTATLEAIWTAWTPDTVGRELADLHHQLATPTVPLVDPLTPTT
ncbi:MAG: hypothetical protein JO057_31855 [Chloroflexi bacterium]|nr:hypothetical protein [Chloroflexota bacterium]